MHVEAEALTFQEIADRWSRETNWSSDEILEILTRSIYRCEFESDDGDHCWVWWETYPKGGAPRRHDKVIVDEEHQPTARRKRVPLTCGAFLSLLRSVDATLPLPPTRDLIPEPGSAPAPWSSVRKGIKFDVLDAYPWSAIPDDFKRSYLDVVWIEKGDFGRWCERHKFQLPRFWFGCGASTPSPVSQFEFKDANERDCFEYLKNWGETSEPSARNTKATIQKDAQERFGVSKKTFEKLWSLAMPVKFKQPGARPTNA